MRKYSSYTEEVPMLTEHDLGPPHIIEPNTPIKVTITVLGNKITYAHNDNVVFEMDDKLPYMKVGLLSEQLETICKFKILQ